MPSYSKLATRFGTLSAMLGLLPSKESSIYNLNKTVTMIHVEAASRNARGFVYNPNAMYIKSIQDLEELYAKRMTLDLSAYFRLSDGSHSHNLRSI